MRFNYRVVVDLPESKTRNPAEIGELIATGLRHALLKMFPYPEPHFIVLLIDIERDEHNELEPLPAAIEYRRHDSNLERIEPIDIDARRQLEPTGPREGPSKYSSSGFARCGNCLDRIPITDDPIENHHRAQQHKLICGRRQGNEAEQQKLVREFEQQPHIIAMHQLHEAEQRRLLEPAAKKPERFRRLRALWKFLFN